MTKLWAILFLLSSSTVWARESYEAKPSLIPAGGLPVFYDSQGPLSYNVYTKHDLPSDAVDLGPVQSLGCQYGLSIPITAAARGGSSVSGAIGNGGYRKAFADLQKRYPGLRGLYDVEVDAHLISVLGIFSRLCSEINAKGFR